MVLSVFDDWYSVPFVKTVKTIGVQSKQQKSPSVYQSSRLPKLYQQCTNRQKQSKDSQTAKNDHWCTNRHMIHSVRRIHKAATSRDLHHMCLGSGHSPSPVGRADSMCLHGRPCIWLPFAAACCYTLFYLLMIPAARLVCQRPSSNFPYFRTPLANFLLSRPNSVEYGNSKATTLLPSAKCTRPLFQGRTGCGRRPSGWDDIVTCQRLVHAALLLNCRKEC